MTFLSFSVVFFGCSEKNNPNPVTQPAVALPSITTAEISDLSRSTAVSGGVITSDGGAAISARGVCWSTNPAPTVDDQKTEDGTGAGSFKSQISHLTFSSTYYARAYAVNRAGTGYGNVIPFTTFALDGPGEPLTDVDGNVYPTVNIGGQVWMAENLKVTHYRNGDEIPYWTWASVRTGAYAYCNSDIVNVSPYGLLYNWYAVNDPRHIAPEGWHVPSDTEWEVLVYYLCGIDMAGSKLKEKGITLWQEPNSGATDSGASNLSGFSALPAGEYLGDGRFMSFGQNAFFWSSTELDQHIAWYRILFHDSPRLKRSADKDDKKYCLSIRLLRD